MRSRLSIVRATALEVLSEPLTLLVMLSALALTVLAPAFHYHQFGDPTRMARDAGFSALLTGGLVIAVFCTIRSFRREIESGILEMALVHPISRSACFLSKTLGLLVAYLVFALIVFSAEAVIFRGAAVGGLISRRSGDIARLYGPCLAAGVSLIVVPLTIAALLNRFARCRFVPTTFAISLALAVLLAVASSFLPGGSAVRLVPAAVLIVLWTCVFLAAAAAFSVRLRANVSAALVGIALGLSMPAIGNYYLVDALSNGGCLSWRYVGFAALATAPAIAAFLLAGCSFISDRDIQWKT